MLLLGVDDDFAGVPVEPSPLGRTRGGLREASALDIPHRRRSVPSGLLGGFALPPDLRPSLALLRRVQVRLSPRFRRPRVA